MSVLTWSCDGVTMPTPKDIEVQYNKIWSADTGRNDSGNFSGTLLGIKRKLIIELPPLTSSTEINAIKAAVNSDFVLIVYPDETGASQTGTFYFGDLTGKPYSWVSGKMFLTGCKFSAIEV